jgi:hypothetical protein
MPRDLAILVFSNVHADSKGMPELKIDIFFNLRILAMDASGKIFKLFIAEK